MVINIISLNANKPGDFYWPLGTIVFCGKDLKSLNACLKEALSGSNGILFWDFDLGFPDPDQIKNLFSQPVDVWHAGLKLGTKGYPKSIDFVWPTWMFNRDGDPDSESTSWRLSLKACLIRSEVFLRLGEFDDCFEKMEAAALEFGHRCIVKGALLRYMPSLISKNQIKNPEMNLSFEDELRFVFCRFGSFWSKWAVFRAILTKTIPPAKALRAWKKIRNRNVFSPATSMDKPLLKGSIPSGVSVSIIIPTLCRYIYLRKLLDHFRHQTLPAMEILIIDQTPLVERDLSLQDDFKDLPLKVIYLDKAGQCTSRNEGLKMAHGDFILFVDDDSEAPKNLIEKHYFNLEQYKCDVSCGIADETGVDKLPDSYTRVRQSDVFPTNNTMIRRSVLLKSGLFDLAYDRKKRADGDLGMRVYLSGVNMILNPEIRLMHHHALEGGLRVHKARIITHAKSRRDIWTRHLVVDSEIYMAMRYFSSNQVKEMLWLRVFSTFSLHGNFLKKILKAIISFLLLPHTLFSAFNAYEKAKKMTLDYPKIPKLQ